MDLWTVCRIQNSDLIFQDAVSKALDPAPVLPCLPLRTNCSTGLQSLALC